MEEAAAGDLDWLRRMATGTNYPAGDDVLEVAKEAYLRFFSTNGLLPGIFPSLARFEREVIDYAAGLFHGPDAVGSITSGGSESILMGVKSARDRARRLHPEITRPADGRARTRRTRRSPRRADYFGLVETRVPLGADYEIDVDAYRAAITDDTVLLVALGPEPDPRHGRPDRGARADRRRARHRLPRRLVRRRLLPAVRREARRAASRSSTSASRA